MFSVSIWMIWWIISFQIDQCQHFVLMSPVHATVPKVRRSSSQKSGQQRDSRGLLRRGLWLTTYHMSVCMVVHVYVCVCVKRESARQCVCVCDRRGWQSEGSANGRAHASAGPGLWLLISMCHSVPFPTHLAAQINPVHTEWRKPATETRVWCDTHGTSREKKKNHL